MIGYSCNRTGWRYAAIGAGCSAVLLVGWLALELARLRGGAAVALVGSARPAGAPFAFVCDLVGPSLPLLGAALIPAGLAAMAPCLLQMSIVLVTAVAGTAAPARHSAGQLPLRAAGLRFAAGFLGTYAVATLLLGIAGQGLASYAVILRALGGALILLLGLAVLRVLPSGALGSCRGPRWLIITGKASLRRPFGAGVAFAIYCVGCCGPYLAGLALLGVGAGAGWHGMALVGGFALLIGALLLLPIFALAASRRLGQALQRHAGAVMRSAGTLLVVVGVALLIEPALMWALLALE